MTDEIDFKKLVKEHGAKKAIELIRTTGKPLSVDFAKEHKNLEAFSNTTTNKITQQLDVEEKETPTSENIAQLHIPLSNFVAPFDYTNEYYAQEKTTINA